MLKKEKLVKNNILLKAGVIVLVLSFCLIFSCIKIVKAETPKSLMGDLEKCNCSSHKDLNNKEKIEEAIKNATAAKNQDVVDCIKYCTGHYETDDMLRMIIRYTDMILASVGAIALLFFVTAGVNFLVSFGNQEKIGKAKQMLIGAVIGIIFVFAGWTIIQYVYKTLNIKWEGDISEPKQITSSK